MKKEIYLSPDVEMEVMACEQGFALSTNFSVEDGDTLDDNYGDWV